MRVVPALVLTVTLTALSNPAAAQGSVSAGVLAGAGAGVDGGIFGDDDPKSTSHAGITVGLQARAGVTRRTGFVFETTLQPIGVENRHFDETVHTLYLLAGPEVGRITYVRPAFGVGLQSWSGTRSCQCLELAPALGVAAGRQVQLTPKVSIRPEFFVRAVANIGAVGWQAGVQIPVGWTRGRG